MKHLTTEYKFFLIKLASTVIKIVDDSIKDPRAEPIKSVKIVKSNSFGWYVELLRFSGIVGRGKVALWLDLYANIGRPCVSVAFWSTDLKRLNKLIEFSPEDFEINNEKDVEYNSNGEVRATPLPSHHFEKFIVEESRLYYYTKYFPDNINISRLSKGLVHKVSESIIHLASTIPNVLESQQSLRDFPTCKNRKIVRLHYSRERSSRLAQQAKVRDNYHCKVCELNFFKVYGAIGRGYAEAHHIIPLAQLSETSETRLEDLITVCANCHRVLHLMKGLKNDYKVLQKRFKIR